MWRYLEKIDVSMVVEIRREAKNSKDDSKTRFVQEKIGKR